MVNSADFASDLLDHRRQAGAQRDLVTLAVLEAFHAELFVVGRDRRLVLARHRYERREIGAPPRQLFRELEARARRNRIRIDGIIQHPEAVIGAQPLVLAAQVGALAQFEREPQGVERRAPSFAVSEGLAEQRQAVGFQVAVAGALVGDIGGGRRTIEQQCAFAVVARENLQHGARQAQPVRRVGRRHGDELAEHGHAGAKVFLLKGQVGIMPQSGGRFGHRAGIAFDLSLELDRRVVEIAAFENLVGGQRRNNGKGYQRCDKSAGKPGADGREHRGSLPVRRQVVIVSAPVATISSSLEGVEVVAAL